MKSVSKYFLISAFLHGLFIGILFFTYTYFNESAKYYTMCNKGSYFSVQVIDNPIKMSNNTSNLSINKKSNKLPVNYPVDNKADLNIAQKVTETKNLNIKQYKPGSGGTDGENSEIIPLINNDNIINFIPPEYPPSCLALKQEGTVIIRVLVSNDGKIIDNKIYKSSGFKQLDYAVLKVSNLWTVNTPPLKTSWVEVVVNFIIK